VLARDIGAGKTDQESVTLRHGLLLSLVWGVISTLFVFVAAQWSLGVMGAKGKTLELGTTWLRYAAPGAFAGSALFVARSGLQGAGDTRSPMLLAYTRIISSLGDTAFAAHSVAIRIQGLAFMPGMSFSQAATAMTG
jgi:Na+-driven multidrug efflux pump